MDILLEDDEYQIYQNFKAIGFDDTIIIPYLLSTKKQRVLSKGEAYDEEDEEEEEEECDFLKDIFIIPVMVM